MSARRLVVVVSFLAAGTLALGACGYTSGAGDGSSAPSGQAATTTVTESAGASSEVPVCSDDPRADGAMEVVINQGEADCAEVTEMLDEYTELARSGQFGNAGIVPDVRGFSCASPTARSANIAGLGTLCTRGDVEIIVRPTSPEIPGIQQEVNRFIPEGSITNGRSFFALPSGQASCAIYPDHTPPNAECYGPMPGGLPQVPDLIGNPGDPTSVQVDETGTGQLTLSEASPYPLDGVPFTTLEVGQTLASAGFACTVTATDAVTCTNSDGGGFSYSPDEVTIN